MKQGKAWMNEDRCVYRRRVFSARKTFWSLTVILRSANRPQTSSTLLLLPFLAFSYLSCLFITVASRQICLQDVSILWGKQGWSRTSTDLDLSRLLTTFPFPGAYLQGHRCLPCRDPLVSYNQTSPDISNNQQDWRCHHCAAVTCLSLSTLVCAVNRCIRGYILTKFYQATPTVNRDRLSSSTNDDLPIHSLSLDRCPSANPTIGCSRHLLKIGINIMDSGVWIKS